MQLRHELGTGSALLTADDLVRLAKRLDVKARKTKVAPERLARVPLPAIAQLKNGEYLVLAQISEEKALVMRARAAAPSAIPRSQFHEAFEGTLVLLTTRERVAGGQRAFDVSWFIPALVRYRHLLRDVLIASFARRSWRSSRRSSSKW